MRARVRRAKRRAGYTLIEVLMALGVLTSGSVAIMAMIQATTRGNMEARQMTTANQVAQVWLERLRRDALNWTRPSNIPGDPTLLNQTTYLQAVQTPQWLVPAPATIAGGAVATVETAGFDFYGHDLGASEAATYCTNVRLEWIFPGQAMRADVRVWWPRRTNGATEGATLPTCAPGPAPPGLTGNPDVRMVYASTVLRFTPPAGS